MDDQNKKPRVGVATLIVKDNKVLLGHRHDDPIKASSELHGEGCWTIPGGKLDFGEKLDDGAYREALEETGLKIDKTKLKVISVANEIIPDKHFVTISFICHDFVGEPAVMEPDEITEWKWFSFDNLPSPIFSPTEKVIKNYLAKEIYKY
ncbi:MAG: NUDIX domain-containing protein [Candidatus Pacebacteria bacterium]|nr:NUDIX domain-containing protein [Candidatus Paceibacterota bacterium]